MGTLKIQFHTEHTCKIFLSNLNNINHQIWRQMGKVGGEILSIYDSMLKRLF